MKHLPIILALATALGCGSHATPPPDDPTAAAEDEAGEKAAPSPDAPEDDKPAHVITGINPITELGPGCKHPEFVPYPSLPILKSLEELEKLLKCKTTVVVDWTNEALVPVSLEGINRSWRYEGQSTKAGVTTITIETSTIARGAALKSEDFWLVRVPAATTSAVIQMTSPPQKADAPLYP